MYSAAPSSWAVNTRKERTAAIMEGSLGFMMGRSSPWARAMPRNAVFSWGRTGRPKDTLETPSTVFRPSSSLTVRTARRVSHTSCCWALAVRVRQSMYTSSLGMPASSAASRMRRAISTRSSALAGMPLSLRVRPTTAAPYFLHRGSTAASTAGSAFTEFTMGLPL